VVVLLDGDMEVVWPTREEDGRDWRWCLVGKTEADDDGGLEMGFRSLAGEPGSDELAKPTSEEGR
jgi:hypothetical protein